MSATLTPATDLVLDFTDIDGGMLAAVGGKAANLGELTRAGLPVPPGLCLTTEAYRQATAAADLDEVLAGLERTPSGDVAALTALAGRARAAVLAAPVPAGIAAAVAEGYARLGADAPVAVRSSATAEDLPFASFAGQQDTYLNVVGEAAVLDAVRRCWASLWTDRAVVYRAANGIDARAVRLAVVVQRMVDAAVAGVLFTANPVTGRRRQAVVDASPGLGEAVVSGAVNPDHFVVDTASGTILDRRLGDKRLAVRPLPGGGTEQVALEPGADTACLTDAQVVALARLGDRVEAHYGAPQDTEWAVAADGTLWLTQARPVTTLFPLPDGAPGPGADPRVYFCFSVAQGVFRPITPAGMAAFRLIGSGASRLFGFPVADPLAGPPLFTEAGRRVFLDVTTAVRSRVGQALIPRVLGVMEARSAVVFRELFTDPRLSVTRPSRLPFLRRVGRVALRYKVPPYLVHALVKPDAARARMARIGERLDTRLAAPAELTPPERLDWIERLLRDEVAPMLPGILPVAAAGFVALGLADRLLGPDAAVGEVQAVLRGIPHNVTTEMDLALWQIAVRLRADGESARVLRTGDSEELGRRWAAGELPEPVHRELADFFHRYGHRAVAEIDLGMPRWSDDPRYLLGVLANYLRMSPEDSAQLAPDRLFAQGDAEARAMVETLAGRAARRGRWRGRAVRTLLGRARALAGVRELPKFYLVRIIAAARAQLGLVGAELARQGRIARPDDVYFLDLRQARAGLAGADLHEPVERARQGYGDELRRRHIPRVLLSDGTEPEAGLRTAAPDGALVGTPASAGTVTGTARVILDPVGAHLEPGEILVCPSTDPGWTPLFLTAGGLVMEMGGANSHGAVVAREYGIPAVVGVPDAVATVTTGARLTVDGTAGTVLLV
ncbi:phosphoenolpyruvate synthase [Catellatospora sp. TT07R-123]|uniref:PEP/pyruvate-binding domain-containing protein n=1 Tax=Catellatospora sp. TT07R-123 TaxID=2733863 RepID=UPI001B1E124D|nr:PEP/pyruvate-binding domain-containing protein [Catellatospora sp. TT07R-123]GHJ49440.1 phosphoenolpyruvate synthase [Catellatospora sp. TT07R-123]